MLQLKSISNPDLLKVLDEDTREICYGCNQNWYPTLWRRLSGCGPTVASNLIFYLYHTYSTSGSEQSFNTKKNCLVLMEEIWKYVTPTISGVSTTKMFYEAFISYAKSKGFNVKYRLLDLPKSKSSRPEFSVILNFLEEALLRDSPVAFLNLCNGNEKNLEQWHWVTIISLEYRKTGQHAFVNILDNGRILKIDLALWYATTTRGGGFVYFAPI